MPQYPVVLYVDSDCAVDVNLLTEHARLYGPGDGRRLGGVVGLTRFVGGELGVAGDPGDIHAGAFSYHDITTVVPWGPTCNMSYQRRVVEEVGLFDTSFPFALGAMMPTWGCASQMQVIRCARMPRGRS